MAMKIKKNYTKRHIFYESNWIVNRKKYISTDTKHNSSIRQTKKYNKDVLFSRSIENCVSRKEINRNMCYIWQHILISIRNGIKQKV